MPPRGANMFNVPKVAKGTNAEEILKNSRSVDKKGTIIRLSKYILQFKGLLFIALILSISSNIFSLIGPKLSGAAIDAFVGVGKVNFGKVYYFCGLMAVFYLASSAMSLILSLLMIRISQKIIRKMREDVFNSLMGLPVSFFDTHQTGEILSRISYDIDTVNTSLSTDVVQILTSIITIVGSFVMMVSISPILILVFVFTIPMAMGITRFITKKTRPLFRERSAALGRMNGYVEEMIAGQKTIRAYTREQYVMDKFKEKNNDAVNSYYQADYYGSMNGPSVSFVNNLSLALITVFGAFLYMNGSISIGNISSFVLYSRKFSGPINEAANIFNEFQSALAAAERVFRLIDEPKEMLDNENAYVLENVGGEVTANHVQFAYRPDKPIFTDLNFMAEKGKMIAIVGSTGAGKTTIINLLMRFYDTNGGEIIVDGRNVQNVTRNSLHSSFAMVLQDTWLFHGTVYENVAYGKVGVTKEEVINACKAAKIHNFVMNLPEGYDTILTEEGTNISKGQKQLLTIARAMLVDAPMLILDEATSNVDIRTEAQIQAAMKNLMRNKTCFVIAHRLSTIKDADEILYISDGIVSEKGSHDELMSLKGKYWQMYMAQMD